MFRDEGSKQSTVAKAADRSSKMKTENMLLGVTNSESTD